MFKEFQKLLKKIVTISLTFVKTFFFWVLTKFSDNKFFETYKNLEINYIIKKTKHLEIMQTLNTKIHEVKELTWDIVINYLENIPLENQIFLEKVGKEFHKF